MRTLTSESVTPGHPDKVCDQISDAILDAHLRQDPNARVAAEVLASARGIIIAGEVTSSAIVNPVAVARETIRAIGYTAENGIDPDHIDVQNHMVEQSREISEGVHALIEEHGKQALGSGDQGMMYGYATRETEVLMPAPLMAARAITDRLVELRKRGDFFWLRPDGKAQVTMTYDEDAAPDEVVAVVVSTQHAPEVPLSTVRYVLDNEVVRPALLKLGFDLSEDARMFLNPAGSWSIGGPAADSGLTGRKIIVDTYGGAARHGGGAFSGKDGSKVDRSGAYAARHAAKSLVSLGYAERAEVYLSYAIGVVEPVSIGVETFGTGLRSDDELAHILWDSFDFTPGGIIDRFGLDKPIFAQTASRGHFGHEEFPWEQA